MQHLPPQPFHVYLAGLGWLMLALFGATCIGWFLPLVQRRVTQTGALIMMISSLMTGIGLLRIGRDWLLWDMVSLGGMTIIASRCIAGVADKRRNSLQHIYDWLGAQFSLGVAAGLVADTAPDAAILPLAVSAAMLITTGIMIIALAQERVAPPTREVCNSTPLQDAEAPCHWEEDAFDPDLYIHVEEVLGNRAEDRATGEEQDGPLPAARTPFGGEASVQRWRQPFSVGEGEEVSSVNPDDQDTANRQHFGLPPIRQEN